MRYLVKDFQDADGRTLYYVFDTKNNHPVEGVAKTIKIAEDYRNYLEMNQIVGMTYNGQIHTIKY